MLLGICPLVVIVEQGPAVLLEGAVCCYYYSFSYFFPPLISNNSPIRTKYFDFDS